METYILFSVLKRFNSTVALHKKPSTPVGMCCITTSRPLLCVCVCRVVLVESAFNPLEPDKKKDSLVQQASSSK